MDENKREHNNGERLLIGMALGGDGDLLHLSEGISNDLAYLMLDTED